MAEKLLLAEARGEQISKINALVDIINNGLPLAASGTRGGLQIGYTASGANIPLKLSSEKGYVTVTSTSVTTALGYTPLSLAGGSFDDNATVTFSSYGNRFVTISGNSITADMSNTTGGWAGAFASVKDPTGTTTTMLGWYGGVSGLTHIYMGGTYSDPFMKMTGSGQFTFKYAPKVGSTSVALATDIDTALTEAKTYTDTKVAALVNSAPETLDTLNELSAALGNDPNFATTISTEIGKKQATIIGAATTITSSNLTASRALISNSSGKVAVSSVTSTELGYLSGVTSAIQTQINNKLSLSGGTLTDNLTITAGKRIQTNTIYAPTASGGTTYGAGSNGQVLKSNGTTVYWGTDNNQTYSIATASTAGLVKPVSVITKPTLNSVTTTSGKYYQVQMSSDGNMFVNVPWSDSGDTKVTQTATTSSSTMPLLLAPAGQTSTTTTTANFTSNIYAIPNTGRLFVTGSTNPLFGLQATGGTQFFLQALTDTLYLGPTSSKALAFTGSTGAISMPHNLTVAGTISEEGTTLSSKYVTLSNNPNLNYYAIDGGSTTAGTWLGTNSNITSLFDGLSVKYKIIIAGASTTTFNLNGLGAKTVYLRGTTKLTTQYAVDTMITLIYSSSTGAWYVADYDSTSSQLRQYYTLTTSNDEYPIIYSYTTATGTSSYKTAYGAVKGGFTFNPSTDTLTVPTLSATKILLNGTELGASGGATLYKHSVYVNLNGYSNSNLTGTRYRAFFTFTFYSYSSTVADTRAKLNAVLGAYNAVTASGNYQTYNVTSIYCNGSTSVAVEYWNGNTSAVGGISFDKTYDGDDESTWDTNVFTDYVTKVA